MTKLFHYAFLGRKVNIVGDQYIFTDGLPPPTEQELIDTYQDALTEYENSKIKIWNDTESFLSEFSLEEMASISLSVHPIIAGLRLLLSCWKGQVFSNDPRVIAGLDALVQQGIISEDRKAAITLI